MRKIYSLIFIIFFCSSSAYPISNSKFSTNLRAPLVSDKAIIEDFNGMVVLITRQRIDILWKKALSGLREYGKDMKDLRLGDTEAHGRFRYILAKLIVEELTSSLNVVRNVWLFGSVNGISDEIRLSSDIDFIIEVGSEEEKKAVYGYFELLNKYLTLKFNDVMKDKGIILRELIDVTDKVFLRDEIIERKGFAAVIGAADNPATLLYHNVEL